MRFNRSNYNRLMVKDLYEDYRDCDDFRDEEIKWAITEEIAMITIDPSYSAED